MKKKTKSYLKHGALFLLALIGLTACASPIEKLEAQIEKTQIMNALLCKTGKVQQWSYLGSHYDLITCASGETFSIKKD